MADGFKSGLGQLATDVGEAVVKPVVDEVGKAIEEGAQSIVGTPKALDPAVQQKKKAEEEKRKQWALGVIDWNKQLEEAQQKVRRENLQKLQSQKQQKQQEKRVEQFKMVEKEQKQKQLTRIQIEATKAERKGGVGG